MAHLKTDLRPCCKDCVYLGYYDDRQSSWYYCSYLGNAYDSIANKNVDHIITTVLEKRDGDFVPRLYEVFSCDFCTRSVSTGKLISIVDTNLSGVYKDALIHVLKCHGKD